MTSKSFLTVFVIGGVIWAALLGGALYAVVHFLNKAW